MAIYFSRADQVLQLSMVVNLGAKRLGQDGPHNRADPNAFPPDNSTWSIAPKSGTTTSIS